MKQQMTVKKLKQELAISIPATITTWDQLVAHLISRLATGELLQTVQEKRNDLQEKNDLLQVEVTEVLNQRAEIVRHLEHAQKMVGQLVLQEDYHRHRPGARDEARN